MNEITNDEALLEAYVGIWNNRRMKQGEEDPAQVLSELIRRELLDENAHPRARKPMHEKFQLSMKRIKESSLSEEEKTAIISVYLSEQERIRNSE